jgi:hypothetical protein
MLWGIPDLDLSLFAGLNAKVRRVAGPQSLLYNLIVTWRVKVLVVEIVVSDWWGWSSQRDLRCN